MLVTTRGRYALRMMLNIAGYETDTKIALRKVAEHEGVSLKYLEQLAHSMVRAGLLTSARGHGGGYALAKAADRIPVGEILRAAEGGTVSAAYIEEDADHPTENARRTASFWRGLNAVVDAYVNATTLADLAAFDTSDTSFTPEDSEKPPTTKRA